MCSSDVLFPGVGDLVDKYSIEGVIGKNPTSVVYVCGGNDRQYALKCTKVDKDNEKFVNNEVGVLKEIDSPYIVKCIDTFEFNKLSCIVMPLALADIHSIAIKNTGHKLPESDVKKVVRNALKALIYLNTNNIIHRDIKPENLLVLGSRESVNVCLTDFGFAKKLKESGELCDEYIGTIYYAAPEIINGKPYDSSVDIWSLGVTMYILLCGELPFPIYPESVLRDCVSRGSYFFNKSWKGISKEAKDLVSKMIVVDPSKRITPAEALSHPWFDGYSANGSSFSSLSR